MSDHYILQGKTAVPADTMTWARWYETAKEERIVKQEDVAPDVRVSTVFLGLNHNWGDGPPHIFETMVFGGLLDQEQDRYSTWEEAEAGHEAMVERAKEAAK